MDFIHFISREDELNGLGMALGLGFVMSEEELLLGQVSWASLGLSNASCVASPRKGRSSDGPGFGVAHYLWAGPHNSPSKLRFLSPSEEKSGVLMLMSGQG